jgi:hypothetical protein
MIAKLNSILFAAVLAFAPVAEASQNQLSSPTTGTVSGLQLTNNYNNALDSLNTANSGTSAPTNQLSGLASVGNIWLNTTSNPYPWKTYDGASWVDRGYLDVVNHRWLAVMGGGTATISSASTTDLCSNLNNYLTISGVVTITSFGSSCEVGQEKPITFSGVLQITYNATSMILPGAANITTAAGDTARAIYLGSSNWQVLNYVPASGQALVNPAVPVGVMLDWGGFTVPTNYLESYGQTVSRATYPGLLSAYTSIQSVTRTSGSPTLTGFTDTTKFGYGQCVEGTGIPNIGSCTSFILSCTSTTCTLNGNASSSGTANVTVFFYGNGDGSGTITMPDCRGKTIVFRDNEGGSAAAVAQVAANLTTTATSTSATVSSATGIAAGMYVINANVPANTTISSIVGTAITLSQAASGNGSAIASRFSSTKDAQMLGSVGGSPSHVQTTAELATHTHVFSGNALPPHSHNLGTSSGNNDASGTGPTPQSGTTYQTDSQSAGTPTGTNLNAGSSAAMLNANPALVMTCIVRVSSATPIGPDASRQLAANDNALWSREAA